MVGKKLWTSFRANLAFGIISVRFKFYLVGCLFDVRKVMINF